VHVSVAGESTVTQAGGLLVDVAGAESSTDKVPSVSAQLPASVQPVVDIDAAGAIPEDNFTK